MDFYDVVCEEPTSNNRRADFIVRPDFKYNQVEDLVCKGGDMYAFWYEGRWNTNMNDLITIIDNEVLKKRDELAKEYPKANVVPRLLNNHSSKLMETFKNYTKLSNQSNEVFNSRIIFSNEEVKKTDYATTRLEYTPSKGKTPAFDELMTTLYDQHELDKILWFIGALLTNSMSKIEKFMFLYGGKGTGKGTVIKVMEMLFNGYIATISLHTLTSGSEFATSQIQEVPLLIDADADLSKITNDTNLLKLTAHEPVNVNMKYKQTYDVTFKGLLIAASNQRYKVRNVDSGITRRAVVVEPSQRRVPTELYFQLLERIKFELPHIAQKAIDHFTERGPFFYEDYINIDMASATDHIFSFVRETHRQLGDPTTLKRASELYKIYLDDIGFDSRGYKRIIKEELKRYYFDFDTQRKIGGNNMTNVYSGFKYNLVFPDKQMNKTDSRAYPQAKIEAILEELDMKIQPSILDDICKDYPAQLTTPRGTPMYQWDNVRTTLKDIDTKMLHYVRLPINHIVIDLDKVNKNGEKDLEENLRKAQMFPPTYTELSKSGQGVHLHYIYEGDVTTLESLYEDDVEVKVFTGKSSLRRRLTKCNNTPMAHISSGLPMKRKEGINMYEQSSIIAWDERKMRTAVKNNILKKYHANTKPSMDFIDHIFKEAQKQGKKYDLRDLRQEILIFAASSTNQSKACIDIANKIVYSTIEDEQQEDFQKQLGILPKEDLYFVDTEVFPNLFIVCFKKYGKDNPVETWINPDSNQIETLLKLPIVGFNNRRYDNHILYSRLIDDDPMKQFTQSQRIINKESGAFFGAAYELSYADIYEYSSNKKSLKKWMVELGINYDELDIPWDQPVEESMWDRIAEYCVNDVLATEAVFEETYADFNARCIIAELSGLSFNAKTQDHAAKIIFGDIKNPQDSLVYTDLSKEFPGYTHGYGKYEYRGENPGRGGYIYAEPGIYKNVVVLDVASMHPNSAINLNYFGPYTKNFADLVHARIAIKHNDFDTVREMFDGRLKPYLEDESTAKDLSYSLKIIINIVYGMSSAPYVNKFKNKENVDNIIAKRGALFMIDLLYAVQEQGYQVVHIKTDSIKIANADKKIVDFVIDFGKKYKYDFEHEVTYDKFALVNKTTYISCYTKDGKTVWDPVGEEFAQPFVLKNMFTKEAIAEEDFVLVKEVVGGKIYLDDIFVGRLGQLYCSLSGYEAVRVDGEKRSAVNGTKGYKWRQYSNYLGKEDVDISYYNKMLESAYKSLEKVGDPSVMTDWEPIPF